ncbi:hypothetical protein CN367_11915 [Priestia megaterium]|nr:hypothetical protein CN367_11915 [Priestia megaterium]
MIPQAILQGSFKEARKIAKRFVDLMGDDFYLEIQATNFHEQKLVNNEILKIADELNIQTIVTGDVHFVEPEDVKAHLGMLCLGRKQKIYEVKGYDGEENYYLKHGKEIFVDLVNQGLKKELIIEVMNNTGKLADKVDFELVKEKDHLPAFPVEDGMTPDKLIGTMVKEGLMRKIDTVTQVYINRLKYELSVIREKGYQDYFLIVADAIKKGKELGIMFAPARGSGAGSLVSYLLDITEVDPIRHKLFFERFLDVTRLKMPDIDTDIEDERRYEVIDYLISKYGKRRVAQILNDVKMSPKSAFKNALMVYGIPFGEANKITDLVDAKTIEDAYKLSPELYKMKHKSTKDARGETVKLAEVFDLAERFEGVTSGFSKHAGGLLITQTDIDDYFPIFKSSVDDAYFVTQWDKDDIEAYGGVKFDFLGLSTLRTIGLALRSIYAETGIRIDVNEIYRGAMDDSKVYERIAKGMTENSFQLNSSGMQQLCRAVRPTHFEHIVAINALYRPPALASGDTWRYARIKNGEEPEYYSHPDEKEITGDTYGVITYQEHVMQLVHKFAGWDFGRGDKLRKMSAEQLEELRSDFVTDCSHNGYFAFLEEMDEIWNRIIRYMGYGFNKSHGVAYSMITYMTVYLETHYPEHWQSAIMTTKMGEQDKVAQVFQDVKKAGFEFQPPSVNKSDLVFTANKGKIIFPLGMIKGVGDTAVTELLAHRPFTSLDDLMERVNKRVVSARAMKPLILAGAFDELYPSVNRLSVLAHYYILKGEKKKADELLESELNPWTEEIQAEHEKDLLGIYISSHPLGKYHFRDWSEYHEGQQNALIGGVISKVKSFNDKNGNRMAFVTLETLEGMRKVIVFASTFKKLERLLKEKNIVMVEGKKQGEEMLANKVKELD